MSTENTNPENWAAWYLTQEADKLNDLPQIAKLCVNRLKQFNGVHQDRGAQRIVVITNGGHWGRGETILDAAKEAKKAGASRSEKASVVLILNDEKPYVDGMGTVNSASQSASFTIGIVGTIGSILKANA